MRPLSFSPKHHNIPATSAAAVNEEWSTLALHVTSSTDLSLQISSAKRPKRREVRIDTLTTSDDLAALKRKDPFLYYSIPPVMDAEMKVGEVTVSCLEKFSVHRNAVSCPSKLQTQAKSSPKTISRKTCISFECHADKVMAELLAGHDDEDNLIDSFDDLDDILSDLLSSDD
mmetsp:Transcript_31143/g.62694  ORF Transcript_31143/g.62694 Transcript_31143/m.62694 type:complete len:172 (-) Transcript_31143:53-568(-)